MSGKLPTGKSKLCSALEVTYQEFAGHGGAFTLTFFCIKYRTLEVNCVL